MKNKVLQMDHNVIEAFSTLEGWLKGVVSSNMEKLTPEQRKQVEESEEYKKAINVFSDLRDKLNNA